MTTPRAAALIGRRSYSSAISPRAAASVIRGSCHHSSAIHDDLPGSSATTRDAATPANRNPTARFPPRRHWGGGFSNRVYYSARTFSSSPPPPTTTANGDRPGDDGTKDESSSTGGVASNDDPPKNERRRVNVEHVGSAGTGIVHVKLNRPDKMNGLDMPMFHAIAETAGRLRDDRSIRAVILSGEGRAFCAGLDFKSVMTSNPKKNVARLLERPSGYCKSGGGPGSLGNLAQDVAYLWRDVHCPVIAALHGTCFGGGLQIALGADFRFATPDCRLSVMEAKWGLIPDMSASVTLRELVRMDVAKELAMTGRIITGEEAARLGLVTRCAVDPLDEARKLAEEIVGRSPDAVAATKRLFQDTWVASEKHCLEVETHLQTPLLASWNQIATSGRNMGVGVPFKQRRDIEANREDDKTD